MVIILGMARVAIGGSSAKILGSTAVQVTLVTGNIGMFSGQAKCKQVMIEVLAISINSIMTGQAVLSKGVYMGLGKTGIHLGVAFDAYSDIESDKILLMTIFARELGPIRFGFMPAEVISEPGMVHICLSGVDQRATMLLMAISAFQAAVIF